MEQHTAQFCVAENEKDKEKTCEKRIPITIEHKNNGGFSQAV